MISLLVLYSSRLYRTIMAACLPSSPPPSLSVFSPPFPSFSPPRFVLLAVSPRLIFPSSRVDSRFFGTHFFFRERERGNLFNKARHLRKGGSDGWRDGSIKPRLVARYGNIQAMYNNTASRAVLSVNGDEESRAGKVFSWKEGDRVVVAVLYSFLLGN